jgi:hypothetical protein
MHHTQHVTVFTFYLNGYSPFIRHLIGSSKHVARSQPVVLLTFSFCILEQDLRTTAVSAS